MIRRLAIAALVTTVLVYVPFKRSYASPACSGPQWRAAESVVTDSFGRVVKIAGKQIVPCTNQNARTAVLLIIGQSNSSNWGEHSYQSTHGPLVLNYFGGKCYVAKSPLVGADGTMGEPWTALGNKLIESRIFERVILVSSGIAGSSIMQWQKGGNLHEMLMEVLLSTRRHYRITHVLWHQGETDYAKKTSARDYIAGFHSLAASLREHRVSAPIFVSTASRCGNDPTWIAENPIAQAQRALAGSANILAGPDTDSLVTLEDRQETGNRCHFKFSGQEKFSQAWLPILGQRISIK